MVVLAIVGAAFGGAGITTGLTWIYARGIRQERSRGSLTRQLLAVVVWLLPAADQARAAEEYQSELWELAQSRTGRLRQLLYVLGIFRFVRAVRGQRGRRRVALSAAALLAAAVWLLPAVERIRYAQEWRSELWELGQSGRLRQLLYALRQFRNAPSTGSALRSQRRRKAAP